MLVSLRWLKEFVSIPQNISPQKLGELLTMHTVEIEDVVEQGAHLENIVVGSITKLHQHPNADRLRIAVVSDGKKSYRVVCGGSNLFEGMLVAFAKVGAQVRWHGEGDLIRLEPATIRGEESHGMICAASEIGLEALFVAEDDRTVVDLGAVATVRDIGKPLKDVLALDDVLYDIDNKSMTHRPDLWSHYGLARDIAAFLPAKLKPLPLKPLPRAAKKVLKVTVADTKRCTRYMGAVIEGIAIQPSPEWMQKRLAACGVRPINNVVDVTNYVMLETGQPTHAFDADMVGSEIVVRPAQAGERLVTLDGKKRALPKDTLVIADAKKPIAIAGVMGGEASEVGEKTTRIIIEAATFDAVSVRVASQALGLRTEASARFEKTLDPTLPETALKRIVELLGEVSPAAKLAGAIVDRKHALPKPQPIAIDVSWLQARLGEAIPSATIKAICQRLGFSVQGGAHTMRVTPPSWRATKDITIPEDVLEEVARIHGFERITPSYPSVPMQAPTVDSLRAFVRQLQDELAWSGRLHETISSAFVNEAQLETLSLAPADHVRVANPISSECTLLRQSLVPTLLDHVIVNQRNVERIGLFEVGRVFMQKKGTYAMAHEGNDMVPSQPWRAAIVHNGTDSETAFFAVKGIIAMLAQRYHVTVEYQQQMSDVPAWASAMYAELRIGKNTIGFVTTVHDAAARSIGLKTALAIAELNVAALFDAYCAQPPQQYQSKPQYPATHRDMAFVVKEKIVYNEIVETIQHASELVENIELFDIYRGDKVGEGNKSIAVHVTLRDQNATLSSAQVDAESKKITKAMQKKLGATLRDF